MADDFEDRKQSTFEQAEGADPLPNQLKLKQISPELRAALWRARAGVHYEVGIVLVGAVAKAGRAHRQRHVTPT
jgi:hypothetical protein